jgi:hypothetical protein
MSIKGFELSLMSCIANQWHTQAWVALREGKVKQSITQET